jgi:hypothetical protein
MLILGPTSEASIKAKIAMARAAGWSDGDILRVALANVYGATRRRELVVEWGKYLGIETNAALQLARRELLIPTAARPASKKDA